MKAVLIQCGGFKKVINVSELKDTIDIMIQPEIKWDTTIDYSATVTCHKVTFYYSRDFYDEDEQRVLVYKER